MVEGVDFFLRKSLKVEMALSFYPVFFYASARSKYTCPSKVEGSFKDWTILLKFPIASSYFF